MSDDIWKRDETDSPCVKVCLIHEGTGYCLGCYRTRDEIAGWSEQSDDERKQIKSDLENRKKLLRKSKRARRRSRT